MRIDERLTRTKASRYVWGGLTLLCALGLVYALRAEQTALQDEIDAANTRTARYASTVVYETVTAPSVSSTELDFRFRDMLVAAQGAVFTDPTVARMRLWDVDGVLRFSTDQPRAEIGVLQVQDQRVLDAATEGRSTFTQTTEPFTQATTGRDGEPTRLLQTFVPLNVPDRIEPLGAVQIDYLYDSFVEASREPWLQVQVVTAGLLGLFALLFLLSLRRPIVRTATPAPVTAPAAIDTADDDHAPVPVAAAIAEPDPAATKLREELDVAQEQLKQAEEAYHYLETRLKKTQEDLATSDAEPAPEIQEQVAAAERDRAMAEARAELAEERLAEMQRRLERLSSGGPPATAAATAEAAPATNGAAAARPTAPAAKPTAPEPPTSERAPAPVAEPEATAAEPVAPEATYAAAPKAPPVVPAREPEPVGASSPDDEEAPADPASELRARLARTAARKKLGPNVGE